MTQGNEINSNTTETFAPNNPFNHPKSAPAMNYKNIDAPTTSTSTSTPVDLPAGGPGDAHIEVKLLTPQEQTAQFNANINIRKNYLTWYFRCRKVAAVGLPVFAFLTMWAFFYAIRIESPHLFGFSVILGFYTVSFFVYLYRFPKAVNREHDIKHNRELKASMMSSTIFVMIGIILLIHSFDRMASGIAPILTNSGLAICTFSVLASTIAGVVLTWAGTKVDSFTVMKGSMLSFSIAVIAFFMELTVLVAYYASPLWWLDCLLDLFIGVFFIAYASRSLIMHAPQIRLWCFPPKIPAPSPAVTLRELDKQWDPAASNNQAQAQA